MSRFSDYFVLGAATVYSFFISEVLGNALFSTIVALFTFYNTPIIHTSALLLSFQALIAFSTVLMSVKAFHIVKTYNFRLLSLAIAGTYGVAFAVTTLANELHSVVLTLLKL